MYVYIYIYIYIYIKFILMAEFSGAPLNFAAGGV